MAERSSPTLRASFRTGHSRRCDKLSDLRGHFRENFPVLEIGHDVNELDPGGGKVLVEFKVFLKHIVENFVDYYINKDMDFIWLSG